MEDIKIRHSEFDRSFQIFFAICGIIILVLLSYFCLVFLNGGFRIIFFILAVLFSICVGYTSYKLPSTVLTFTEEGIWSKRFGSSFLDIKDMKNIWIVEVWSKEKKRYTPHTDPEDMKGKLIVFGNVNLLTIVRVNNTNFFGFFNKYYTTIYYRPNIGLENIMNYYYDKIEEQKELSKNDLELLKYSNRMQQEFKKAIRTAKQEDLKAVEYLISELEKSIERKKKYQK